MGNCDSVSPENELKKKKKRKKPKEFPVRLLIGAAAFV